MLRDKKALVTGSARGIGLSIARGFQAAGAQVWIHDRTEITRELADEFGGRVIAADFSHNEAVADLAEKLQRATLSLDVLVNNAGIETIMPISALNISVMEEIWRVNAQAPVHLVHALLPLLKAAKSASVINITSIHQTVPYPSNIAYCMSKAALAMATKVASLELAPFGIRVNNIAPGAVQTDINREVIETIGRETWGEWIPAGRVGTPEEIVGPALFLASNSSSYMSGSTLTVDGAYCQNLVRYRPDAIH